MPTKWLYPSLTTFQERKAGSSFPVEQKETGGTKLTAVAQERRKKNGGIVNSEGKGGKSPSHSGVTMTSLRSGRAMHEKKKVS